MATFEPPNSKMNELAVTPRDILFECPSCRKSLLVDEAAEGMIVNCPKCRTSVIVPPKPASTFAPPPPTETGKPAEKVQSVAQGDHLRGRLVTITGKLKELQTQRTEINNRLAARINDINRDLVMMARLETSHQQVLAELNQLVSQLGTHTASGSADTTASGRTRVNLRS